MLLASPVPILLIDLDLLKLTYEEKFDSCSRAHMELPHHRLSTQEVIYLIMANMDKV